MKAKSPYKQVSWICPYCDKKIGSVGLGVECAADMSGGLPRWRQAKCECGTWRSSEDLAYTGKGGIYDDEVPFITYKPNEGVREVEDE